MQYITMPCNAICHNLLKCDMNCNIAAVRRQPFVKLDLVIDQWSAQQCAPQLNQLRKFDLFSSTNHVTAFAMMMILLLYLLHLSVTGCI